MSSIEEIVAAIRVGEPVVIPTDTVYGLACTPHDEESARTLSALKGRAGGQPIALVAPSVESLLECMPELRGRAEALIRALLPGPYTLIVPNPAERFPWLTGDRSNTLGVRVPDVAGSARELLAAAGVVAATSANRHGGPDPRRIDEVPDGILDSVGAVFDVGELPGVPSTVLDLTGPEPRVLREGAVPAQEALARVSAVVAQ